MLKQTFSEMAFYKVCVSFGLLYIAINRKYLLDLHDVPITIAFYVDQFSLGIDFR